MASAKRTYTPSEISRMSDKAVRSAYSELRSIARKRADRLEAAGFSIMRFPSLREMQLDNEEVRRQLQEVSFYLKSPSSQLKEVKKEKELSGLMASGYTIQDQKQFGQFMDYFRSKYKGRVIPPSDIPATIYNAAERKGMTTKTLQREFGKYLSDQKKMEELRHAINIIKEDPKYNRVTVKQLKKVLK